MNYSRSYQRAEACAADVAATLGIVSPVAIGYLAAAMMKFASDEEVMRQSEPDEPALIDFADDA